MKLKLLFGIVFLLVPFSVHGQELNMEFIPAVVEHVSLMQEADADAVQVVEAILLKGQWKGENVSFLNTVIDGREDLHINAGDKIVLQRLTRPDDSVEYFFLEHYRVPALLLLTVLFFVVGTLIGRRRGAMSILGLALSVLIIFFGLIPFLLRGYSPLGVVAIGSVFIAGATILISHGFYRRTFLALISTYATLFVAILLAVLAAYFARIFGLGSEEGVFLQNSLSVPINLRGLFLGGVILGTLGVLDDITTTQVTAVEEIHKANAGYNFIQLYRAGFSIGYEHIASMINTLALAYIGASLPLFMLFSFDSSFPLWVTVNSAFFAEEIVRTLVGSMALLFAAPIATWIAARWYAR